MSCNGSNRTKFLICSLGLALVLAAASLPAGAVCLANGKPCGAPIAANDRSCCPGSICGPWGNVCQPGCRINNAAYRGGQLNPNNACQVCQPNVSTTAWTSVPNGSSCSDSNRCTQTDTCQAGYCVGSNPVVCTPQDQCHVAGTCNPASGLCSNPSKADNTPCNDYNACTLGDTCQLGSCVGTAVVCQALDQCHDPGYCVRATGQCTNPNKPDGTACNDLLLCTTNDTCQGGSCGGAPVQCPADPCNDPCHVAGTCDPGTGGCIKPNAPNGTPCSDGDICTLDACVDGTCTAEVKNPAYDHCSNGVLDCDETGVDCGGSCPLCNLCPSPCSPIHCEPPAAVCGTTGPAGTCLCAQTTEGACFCGEIFICGSQPACTTSADCAAGTQCQNICGCGGGNFCVPACGTNPFRALALPPATRTSGKVN